jgi:hypothetical protein
MFISNFDGQEVVETFFYEGTRTEKQPSNICILNVLGITFIFSSDK